MRRGRPPPSERHLSDITLTTRRGPVGPDEAAPRPARPSAVHSVHGLCLSFFDAIMRFECTTTRTPRWVDERIHVSEYDPARVGASAFSRRSAPAPASSDEGRGPGQDRVGRRQSQHRFCPEGPPKHRTRGDARPAASIAAEADQSVQPEGNPMRTPRATGLAAESHAETQPQVPESSAPRSHLRHKRCRREESLSRSMLMRRPSGISQ